MRAILVAGIMAVAGAAGAADFGVSSEAAQAKLRQTTPALEFARCKDQACLYLDRAAQVGAHLSLGGNGAVEEFAVFFSKENWAVAADYIRSMQSAFLVPPDQIVDVRRAAERVTDGNEDIVASKYVDCRSEASKAERTQFTIYCVRAR